MIKLDDICFAYDSTPVLKHFSTEIADGEFVVIKGDNGCGKSTLLNIINALEFAEIGTYTFDGTVIDKKGMKNEQFAKAFHQKSDMCSKTQTHSCFVQACTTKLPLLHAKCNLTKRKLSSGLRIC